MFLKNENAPENGGEKSRIFSRASIHFFSRRTRGSLISSRPLQIRHRPHRSGRHGPEPDTEHERPRIRGDRVQQDRGKGRRVPQQRRQGHENRRRPFAQGVGRLAEETASGHDARQRYLYI